MQKSFRLLKKLVLAKHRNQQSHGEEEGQARSLNDSGSIGSTVFFVARGQLVVNYFLLLPDVAHVTDDLMSKRHTVQKLHHVFIWEVVEWFPDVSFSPIHLSQRPVPNDKSVKTDFVDGYVQTSAAARSPLGHGDPWDWGTMQGQWTYEE